MKPLILPRMEDSLKARFMKQFSFLLQLKKVNARLYGPVFGSGHTICVYTNCAANNSNETRLSGDVNDTGLNDYTVFTGEQNFTVKEIEVFTLTEEIISINNWTDVVKLSDSAKGTAGVCSIDVHMHVGLLRGSTSGGTQRSVNRVQRDYRSTQ
jgi:hypothetical protein